MTVCGIKHADGVCVMGECPYIKMCCPAVWDKRKSEPQTNEEWFASLPTEEKAKFIFWQHFDVYGKTLYELMVNASKGVSRDKQAEVMIGAVVEWLKEIHE